MPAAWRLAALHHHFVMKDGLLRRMDLGRHAPDPPSARERRVTDNLSSVFDHHLFDAHLRKWDLVADGEPIVTWGSRLLPVRHGDLPAMLKIALHAEEKFGGLLMTYWDGDGAAKVLAQDGDALLLERAKGEMSLADFARNGRDDEATRIICATIAKLHAPRATPLPELIPLPHWFRELEPAAATHGGQLAISATMARKLLDDQKDIVVLHGDIHHDNILDFGERGWLAIDPKRIVGERAFDYANIFCNPDLADLTRPVAAQHFQRRLETITEVAGLDRTRLLEWIVAWTGLSAAWFLSDGGSPDTDLAIGALALAELGR
jgi:streptomycin 6-kinase